MLKSKNLNYPGIFLTLFDKISRKFYSNFLWLFKFSSDNLEHKYLFLSYTNIIFFHLIFKILPPFYLSSPGVAVGGRSG